ncbi:MAG: hypothetical protein XD36_2673 [Halomonas sp. 54_146]|nr:MULTISPECIES: hypothetical protein [unclassified Halomonas]KUJ86877.1 MAG: hypothetical protein XD36_2673 [Halomonas sp. 54_146]HAA44927.1 hypothetical protein [Halomonas sp.]
MTQHLDLNEAIQVKTSLKVLPPGMYTIRYLGTRPTGSVEANGKRSANIPLALSQAPIHMPGEIEFICPEGVSHQTLSAPGDYLIAHVKRGDAVLAASKYAPKPLAGKVDVQWRIESLQQPTAESNGAAVKTPQKHAAPSTKRASLQAAKTSALPVKLTGHIEHRGDVTVGSGEWLGDPKGKARLEGLLIEWQDSPAGVEIIGACRAGNQTLQAKGNSYLGTRRQAAPITQLALCLSGKNAALYHLDAEAVFSDGSRHALGAKEAVQANAEGHLVAVRVAVTAAMATTAPSQATPSPARSAWLDPQATYITKA